MEAISGLLADRHPSVRATALVTLVSVLDPERRTFSAVRERLLGALGLPESAVTLPPGQKPLRAVLDRCEIKPQELVLAIWIAYHGPLEEEWRRPFLERPEVELLSKMQVRSVALSVQSNGPDLEAIAKITRPLKSS